MITAAALLHGGTGVSQLAGFLDKTHPAAQEMRLWRRPGGSCLAGEVGLRFGERMGAGGCRPSQAATNNEPSLSFSEAGGMMDGSTDKPSASSHVSRCYMGASEGGS